MIKKNIIILILLLLFQNITLAQELLKQQSKYPDYSYMYLGEDKYEKFNRKMFAFNLGLNKYAIKPVHILWASIMPDYGMERIQYAYKNIEYPKRLISSLIQKDFKTSKNETLRFLTNTTIGLGGMFDPAKTFFNIESANEDMEQALSNCKCQQGSYIVLPVINGTTARGVAGKILDTALNPTTYVGTPILAMVKAGITVNRTSYMQPLIGMIESNYADPYDITKKMYGIDNYVKCNNFDRKEILQKGYKELENKEDNEKNIELVEHTLDNALQASTNSFENTRDRKLTISEIVRGGSKINDIILQSYNFDNSQLMADIILYDFNAQTPIVDSMRTALLDDKDINKSVWNELSLWNRSFNCQIKTGEINITPDKPNYKFRYILQKNKQSPLAIIYPSIGEGINSHHSVVLAKLFYDEGYSVIIQGSHFQWEFVKSMPNNYRPGIPSQDADYLKRVTTKIVENLEDKYKYKFSEKTLVGTSFGALTTIFLADKEFHNNTLNITKYISICPPINLIYAMEQVDKNGEDWNKNTENLEVKTAITASKVMQLFEQQENENIPEILPFSNDEGKIITGFIMHQKLSDLIFTIENTKKNKPVSIYSTINNMSYKDYANKYLVGDKYNSLKDLEYDCSILSLKDFLTNSDNYKIYHSLDDYLVNADQLKKLKIYSKNKTVLFSNGAHLGFMYRPEFIKELKKDIKSTHISSIN